MTLQLSGFQVYLVFFDQLHLIRIINTFQMRLDINWMKLYGHRLLVS
jgi:hypothetical protein